MHFGKHSNFNDFSDGQKAGEIRQKYGPGMKKSRIFMIFHAFCRPKTMQKHAPLKPLKLKEASSDMLAELPLFASFSRQDLVFFHVFFRNGSRTSFFLFFPDFHRKSTILGLLGAPFWHQMRLKINPKSIPKKHKKKVGEKVMREIRELPGNGCPSP